MLSHVRHCPTIRPLPGKEAATEVPTARLDETFDKSLHPFTPLDVHFPFRITNCELPTVACFSRTPPLTRPTFPTSHTLSSSFALTNTGLKANKSAGFPSPYPQLLHHPSSANLASILNTPSPKFRLASEHRPSNFYNGTSTDPSGRRGQEINLVRESKCGARSFLMSSWLTFIDRSCSNGYYLDKGRCYSSTWYSWGRWVLAAVVIIVFIVLLIG